MSIMKRPWFLALPSLLLFILFIAVNGAYLHRVPGLLGDEGSEGENVFQLLQKDTITIVGERSYIGPIIDYVRVPYIAVFGYTPLALRMLMLTASIATFILAGSVLRKWFGEEVGMIALTFFSFSPVFVLQQRIGWAITLNVVFAWLLMYALMSNWKQKWLLSGLIAGLGLSNDIIFFPIFIAIIVCFSVVYLWSSHIRTRIIEALSWFWIFCVGLIAGFGTQFAVLLLLTEDQGSRAEVVAGFSSRLQDFLPSLPLYVSGSSYVARYTGFEFSPSAIVAITSILGIFAVLGLFHKKRLYVLAIVTGVVMQSYVLLYMVDRFTLRYFAVISMSAWLLAGVGAGVIIKKFIPARIGAYVPLGLACMLSIWIGYSAFIPFLQTGGSLKEFSLGNRNDKSSAFVDIRPLVSCVRGIGVVYSPTQDIFDRLQYLSHEYEDLLVVDGERKSSAAWTVVYRKVDDPIIRDPSSPCPEVPFFRVVKR